MKILEKKYPYGSFKGQKSDGRYIDGFLYKNLQVMADRIKDDMTFLGVCFSSTLEVGTGKSVFCTQIGEAWTEIINNKYNLNLEFTTNNIVFRPKDLIERSFELPKYSFILLDEWEDASYWSELGMTLRQFFRKCRQLNLFMMVIIPNWFQLNLSYAVSRSAFAVDVKFEQGFQRGFFDFYGFEAKKNLYVRGKKFHNYKVQRPNFQGRFTDGYGVPEKEYREAKLRDLMTYEETKKIQTPAQIAGDAKWTLFKTLHKNLPDITIPKLSVLCGLNKQWAYDRMAKEKQKNSEPVSESDKILRTYNNNLLNKKVTWNEEELAEEEKKSELISEEAT